MSASGPPDCSKLLRTRKFRIHCKFEENKGGLTGSDGFDERGVLKTEKSSGSEGGKGVFFGTEPGCKKKSFGKAYHSFVPLCCK